MLFSMIEKLNSFIHSFSAQLLSILILGLMLGTGNRILFGSLNTYYLLSRIVQTKKCRERK